MNIEFSMNVISIHVGKLINFDTNYSRCNSVFEKPLNIMKTKNIKILIGSILYFALLGFYISFFLLDQVSNYLIGRSTVANQIQIVEKLEYPTLTLCMNPATKLSVSQKYGFTNMYDKFEKDTNGTSLTERYDNLSYILNQDFEILDSARHKMVQGVNEVIRHKARFGTLNFDLEPIRTYHFGTCWKLQPMFEITKAPVRFRLTITLSDSLDSIDRPKAVVIHVTSNKTWVGITDSVWPQFKPLSEMVSFEQEYTQLKFSTTKKLFQDGVEDNQECLNRLLKNKTNCDTKCNLLTFGNLPPCPTVEALKCMWTDLADPKYIDCYKTPKAITYDLQQRIDNPYHKVTNLSSVEIYLSVWSMAMRIQEEVPLLTLQDFIGSVGGSLGMFFGFSMSATLLYMISKFLDKILAY